MVDIANPDFYVFAVDVEFSSAGAACVNDGNSDGRINWKVADSGETYRQWHHKNLGAAKTVISGFEE